MLSKTLLILLVAYLGLTSFFFLAQRKLLYYPSRDKISLQRARAMGLGFWPTAADNRGFISLSVGPYPNGTVIVFHGNAGTAADRTYYLEALASLGYRVVLAEYPGFGGRPGKISEHTVVADARQTIASVHAEFGGPLYLLGESLGAGVVAAAVADADLPVAALILITPWDSLTSLAQKIYWFLPVRWFLLDRYDTVQNLALYSGPVAVALAEHDEVVPQSHGLRLYDSLSSGKRLWVFKGASHNSWPAEAEAGWWTEVMAHVSGSDRTEP